MADYFGLYQREVGDRRTLIKLSVYLVTDTSLTTTRGARNDTSYEFDAQYLPEVFIVNTQPLAPKQPVCKEIVTPRFAKLYLANDRYLHVDLLFKPGTSGYNQFFIAVAFNPEIVSIGIEGEAIKAYGLKLLAA